MRVALGILVIFLVGCTQPGTTTFLVKEDISRQQQESDLAECDKDPTAIIFARRSQEDFLRCMKAKGYRETTSKEYNETNSIPTWSGLARPLTR